jgi:hypothetical protein
LTAIITRRTWDRTPATPPVAASQETATTDWLDLIPEGYAPDGYGAAVAAEQVSTARLREVDETLQRLDAALRTGAADPDVAPRKLARLALQANAWRTVREAMPPATSVPAEMHLEVVRAFTSRWPDISPGRPPMFAAEAVHYVIAHAQHRGVPPVAVGLDLQALETFERVTAAGAKLTAAARVLAGPLTEPIENRVRAVIDFGEQLRQHAQLAAAMREVIAANDTERIASGAAHVCPLWGNATVTLEPIPASVAWTFQSALNGDGRPPVSAAQ